MKTLNQIKAALDNSEFHLVYMPTIDLKSGRCVGAETLVRWDNGDELVSPDEFIPIIENTALSGLLTYWVIEQVALDLGDWLNDNNNVHVGINIPPEILGRGGLEYVAVKSGLIDVLDKIVLEITERGFPDKLGIESLSSNNGRVKIAIDDFGTGDANLLHLSQIEADIIKLDKYFIDQIKPNEKIPKIVMGLIAFSKAMGCQIIAEGVESQWQAKAMLEQNVDMAQGWYFSKPLRVDSFIEFHSQYMQTINPAP